MVNNKLYISSITCMDNKDIYIFFHKTNYACKIHTVFAYVTSRK